MPRSALIITALAAMLFSLGSCLADWTHGKAAPATTDAGSSGTDAAGSGLPCRSFADCLSGEACRKGKCDLPECQDDKDCGAGKKCQEFTCSGGGEGEGTEGEGTEGEGVEGEGIEGEGVEGEGAEGEGTCAPNCAGIQCGPDGCGGDCGACTPPATCGGGGLAGVCSVPPDQCAKTCPDGMKLVVGGDCQAAICIDIYEASRSDATVDSPGASATTVTSRAGVLPWNNINLSNAKSACELAGKKLCPIGDWRTACDGLQGDGATRKFSYGDAYVAGQCNDSNPAAGQDQPHPTGSSPNCKTPEGVFDMTGNVAEWVVSSGTATIIGGSYQDTQYLQCTEDIGVGDPFMQGPAVGFRCCATPQ